MSFIKARDISFLLYDWLNVGDICQRPEFSDHDSATFDAILDLSEKLATDAFAPHFKEADENEPQLVDGQVQTLPAIKDALETYAASGFFSTAFPQELGGMQLPATVAAASFAHFCAANIATSAYPMLTGANARLIAAYGTQTQIETWAEPQIEGRYFGTNCLSEPQAGSSLADIRTRAVAEDGADPLGDRYRIKGNKMWISGGDQNISENIVYLVLAKIPDADGTLPAGVQGISLFIVPKMLPGGAPNDVVCAGVNHKMGYRGYTQSLAYARERPQGRVPPKEGKKDPSGPQDAIVAHADVKRMLIQQKSYAEGALGLVLYSSKLLDDSNTLPDEAERYRAHKLLGLLTPITKGLPSEFGLVANDQAIQIHGGYGYTREYDVEQIYRDNRLNPIHEGTHGIQGQDLLGRKLIADKGEALSLLIETMQATVGAVQGDPELAQFAGRLSETMGDVSTTVQHLSAGPDRSRALDDAGVFLSGFGHMVVAWVLLEQVKTTAAMGDDEAAFKAGKLASCRYFFDYELPNVTAQMGIVRNQNATCGDIDPSWF